MSIATELQNLNDNILDAYTAIANKGGTVPTDKNTSNLKTAVGSIPMAIIQTTTATSGSDINVFHTGFCPFSEANASRDFDFAFTLNAVSVDSASQVQMPTLVGGVNESGSPYPGMYIRFNGTDSGRRTQTFVAGVCAFGSRNVQGSFTWGSPWSPIKIKFTRRSGVLSLYINDSSTPLISCNPEPESSTALEKFDNEIVLGADYTSAMTDGVYQRPYRSFSFSNLEFGYLD